MNHFNRLSPGIANNSSPTLYCAIPSSPQPHRRAVGKPKLVIANWALRLHSTGTPQANGAIAARTSHLKSVAAVRLVAAQGDDDLMSQPQS
jgi:hypothetical protein